MLFSSALNFSLWLQMKISVFPSHLPKPQIAGEAGQAAQTNYKTQSCFA